MADDLSSSSHNPIFQLISCIILHDLSLLCSFTISHPLYSSYFIFFAPYFIKLISFISPLFIAAVLLSLLLTTTTAFCPKLPHLELGILKVVIQELKSNLSDVNGDEECSFEDFEIYKMVFDGTLSIRIGDERDQEVSTSEKILEVPTHGSRRNDVTTSDVGMEELGSEKVLENSVGVGRINDATTSGSVMENKILEDAVRGGRRNDVTISDSDVVKLVEEKGLETLFEELDRFEDCTTAIETCADSDKVIGGLRKAEPVPVKEVVSGSEAVNSSDNYKIGQISCRSSSWRSNSSSISSSHGSMREEKEWRRTLACKLFEERHNSRGGEEGMDSLWEAYENDNSKNRKEIMINNNKMMEKNGTKVGIQSSDEEEDDDDDDDEQGMSNGHFCCLQALKLSTGKMHLGMGKPNLLRISKALKGFGWLHHVKYKHGKKS